MLRHSAIFIVLSLLGTACSDAPREVAAPNAVEAIKQISVTVP
jgi:hypothetical protein